MSFVPHAMILAEAASAGEVVAGLLFFGIFAVIALVSIAHESNARFRVVVKGGAPYCPNCNRQVSYRRDYCRCCGFQIRVYNHSPSTESHHAAQKARITAELLEEQKQKEREAAEQEWRLKAEELRVERARRREAKREAREERYRKKGIEPGPLA